MDIGNDGRGAALTAGCVILKADATSVSDFDSSTAWEARRRHEDEQAVPVSAVSAVFKVFIEQSDK
jgi:hypothetical protein